jgi:hypothetical protein
MSMAVHVARAARAGAAAIPLALLWRSLHRRSSGQPARDAARGP